MSDTVPVETYHRDALELSELRSNTSEIVAAFVSKNSIRVEEVPAFVAAVLSALKGGVATAGTSETADASGSVVAGAPLSPAAVKKSFNDDGIVSFIDGKTYKSMKRHLSSNGLTPETYRLKFGLPVDYPMVSKTYSESRSALAKSLGLGQQRRAAKTEAAA